MRRLLALFAALCLAAGAAAEGPAPEEKALELGNSRVSYPAVTGMADAAAQDAVNARIREDLHTEEYLARMTQLISEERQRISVSWRGGILGDVFSALLEAEGSVKPPRNAHVWTWSTVDLRSGEEVSRDALFTDAAAGREALEALLEGNVAEGLSPMLQNSELLPLPEGFLLERTGITLLYDAARLSTLSGRAGAVKFGWNEIQDALDLSEDGIPARIGVREMLELTEESAARLREMTEKGRFPDLPVTLGDSAAEWTEALRLLNDPEEYAGGRMLAPEDARFRGVYLLTDAVDEGWENSRVQGIRMDRGCVWGLRIGQTAAEEWHQLLGEPDETAAFDADRAESWRTVPGHCDYYIFGEHRLQLQYGEDGLLAGVTLAE